MGERPYQSVSVQWFLLGVEPRKTSHDVCGTAVYGRGGAHVAVVVTMGSRRTIQDVPGTKHDVLELRGGKVRVVYRKA